MRTKKNTSSQFTPNIIVRSIFPANNKLSFGFCPRMVLILWYSLAFLRVCVTLLFLKPTPYNRLPHPTTSIKLFVSWKC